MDGINFDFGKGFIFSKHIPKDISPFERIFDIFKDLLTHSSGDIEEAFDWLKMLDKEYNIFTDDYTFDDFEADLKKKGYIKEEIEPGEEGNAGEGNGKKLLTAKMESALREFALDQIFGKLKKSGIGNHRTSKLGVGDEREGENRSYQYGDDMSLLNMTESLKNAQINHGINDLQLTEDDLIVEESKHKAQMSTVLMIDISHSMILYGEDRITPAKKVAMALSELITKKYPKDTLDILVFGDDAWQIEIKDLPYLQVGPYHTNTIAGLELGMDILRRRKNQNKQVFMITDGKPTCMKEGIKYYKNSFGLDTKILNKTYTLAAQLKKLKVPVTTFMIATDPYLKSFVREFTRINNGNAYYSGLEGLGNLVFEDFKKNRRKNL